jgi:hypothetical protein
MEALTLPSVVIPPTAMSNVVQGHEPLAVTVAVLPEGPETFTSFDEKSFTGALKVAVKWTGLSRVGSACPTAWFMVTVRGELAAPVVKVPSLEVARLPAPSWLMTRKW